MGKRTLEVLAEVAQERHRQDVKWGVNQDHPDGTGGIEREHEAIFAKGRCDALAKEGKVTWLSILEEEQAEAFAETDPTALRAELIQVAAVACRWIEAIDGRQGEKG